VLSELDEGVFQCVVAVEPAHEDISGLAVEVELGFGLDGLVVRVALPRRGHVNCTWVLSLARENLVERLGTLTSVKLIEVEELFLMGDQAPR
jgi:mRNA interferase MazF